MLEGSGREQGEDQKCLAKEFALYSVSSGEKLKLSIDPIKFVLSNDPP